MMPDPTTLRAFVAVELPAEIRGLLETTQVDLRGAMGRAGGGVRWTRPESVHLTLQFLGDVAADRVDDIGAAIKDACAGEGQLTLTLHGTGAFPNVNRPRVLWMGLEGDIIRLRALAARIAEQLSPLGYKLDKPFQPHITLGRIRESVRLDELEAISKALATRQTQAGTETAFSVDGVSLMESRLQPGGSVYTRLAHTALR